jgi:hypothetical protein
VNTHQPLKQWCRPSKKGKRNCIATHLYNKHLRLPNLLGKHLRKNTVRQACSLEARNNKAKITHSNMLENVFYLAENAKGNIPTNASINPPSTNA